MITLFSGVDDLKVAAVNPRWTVVDWCWYWHVDYLKALARVKMPRERSEGLRKRCDDPNCVCAKRLR